jgi:hypothetical protein
MPPDWQFSGWVTDLVGHSAIFDGLVDVLASNYFAPKVAAIILLFMWFGTRGSVNRENNQKVIVCVAVGTNSTSRSPIHLSLQMQCADLQLSLLV